MKLTFEELTFEANLRGANLRGADLYETKNKEEAFLPIFCKWGLAIKGDLIKIGCKEKTITEWDSFFESSFRFGTPRNTEEFKHIQASYLAYRSYYEFLKNN